MERLNLLFDLDGTLTNNKEGIVRCVHYAFNRLGVGINGSDDLDWLIGPPFQESFAKLLGPESKHQIHDAIDLYRERYLEVGMYENSVYEGIADTLSELSKTSNLYVATSKVATFSKMILKHFSLDQHFLGIYGSELDGKNADKGELILHLLEQEKLRPEMTIMIGDRKHDMIGARKNRIEALGVGWGFGSEEELMAAGARKVLNNPAQLLKYFQSYPN